MSGNVHSIITMEKNELKHPNCHLCMIASVPHFSIVKDCNMAITWILYIASEPMAQGCMKSVCTSVPNAQHQFIMCRLVVQWSNHQWYSSTGHIILKNCLVEVEYNIGWNDNINFSSPRDNDWFDERVKLSVPQGCRTNYFQGLISDVVTQMNNSF